MTDFEDYVRARGGALLRFAYLLCGDAHRAEDFVQEALIGCHRKWHRIERGTGPDAYVHKAILRQYLSWRRRKPAGEQLTDRFDDSGVPAGSGVWIGSGVQFSSGVRGGSGRAGTGGRIGSGGGTGADTAEVIGDRDEMRRLLLRLPRRQRAVLVLRFYEDLPDAQIADLLGCSPATVRVHAGRGLAALRRAVPSLRESR